MQATTNATNLTTNGANFAASLNYQQQQQQQQTMLNQIHLNQMNLLQTQQQQQQHQQQQQQLQQQQHKDTTFTKIFVGGLPYHTTDESLRQFFQKFGNIEEAVVITDRTTGKSRGYGFVTMETKEAAEAAVYEPNPIIDGRKANVNLAYLGVKSRIVQPTSYIPVSIGRYPMPTSSTPTYGFPQLIYQPVASTPAQFQIATGTTTNFLLSSQQLPAFTSGPAVPPPNNPPANGSQTIPGIFDLSTTIAVNSAAYNSVAAAAAAAALNNNPNRTSPFVNEQAPGASHLATQFIPFGNAGAAANPAASNNSQANSNTSASYFTLPNNHHHLANFN